MIEKNLHLAGARLVSRWFDVVAMIPTQSFRHRRRHIYRRLASALFPLTIVIRPLTADEWPRYRDVRLRALADAPDAFGSTYVREAAFSDDEWMARLESATSDLDALPLVAEESGTFVGLTWARLDANESRLAHVYQVWVAPTHRRRRVGRGLMEAVTRWAHQRGVRRLALDVTCGNVAALAMYERAGFAPTGESKPVRPGSELRSQAMELTLDDLP